jgi:hypothetical protein
MIYMNWTYLVSRQASIIYIVILLILGGGLYISSQSGKKQNNEPNKIKSTKVQDITINSELPADLIEPYITFIKSSLKQAYIPKNMTVVLTQKSTDKIGNAYSAQWNQEGKFITALVGLTGDNKRINYQRIWTMPASTEIDEKIANSMLQELFQESYLSNLPSIRCAEAKAAIDTKITECGTLKTNTTGDLIGVTVRSPISLDPPPGATAPSGFTPPQVTIVSACFIPKEGTPQYVSGMCI